MMLSTISYICWQLACILLRAVSMSCCVKDEKLPNPQRNVLKPMLQPQGPVPPGGKLGSVLDVFQSHYKLIFLSVRHTKWRRRQRQERLLEWPEELSGEKWWESWRAREGEKQLPDWARPGFAISCFSRRRLRLVQCGSEGESPSCTDVREPRSLKNTTCLS